MSYADKLRKFADYLDSHPDIAEQLAGTYNYPSAYLYAENWDHFKSLIRHLDGYEKAGNMGNLVARHTEKTDNETQFNVTVTVTGVCESTPKLDDDGQPVMRPKSRYVQLEEMEPVLEYKCPEVWSA